MRFLYNRLKIGTKILALLISFVLPLETTSLSINYLSPYSRIAQESAIEQGAQSLVGAGTIGTGTIGAFLGAALLGSASPASAKEKELPIWSRALRAGVQKATEPKPIYEGAHLEALNQQFRSQRGIQAVGDALSTPIRVLLIPIIGSMLGAALAFFSIFKIWEGSIRSESNARRGFIKGGLIASLLALVGCHLPRTPDRGTQERYTIENIPEVLEFNLEQYITRLKRYDGDLWQLALGHFLAYEFEKDESDTRFIFSVHARGSGTNVAPGASVFFDTNDLPFPGHIQFSYESQDKEDKDGNLKESVNNLGFTVNFNELNAFLPAVNPSVYYGIDLPFKKDVTNPDQVIPEAFRRKFRLTLSHKINRVKQLYLTVGQLKKEVKWLRQLKTTLEKLKEKTNDDAKKTEIQTQIDGLTGAFGEIRKVEASLEEAITNLKYAVYPVPTDRAQRERLRRAELKIPDLDSLAELNLQFNSNAQANYDQETVYQELLKNSDYFELEEREKLIVQAIQQERYNSTQPFTAKFILGWEPLEDYVFGFLGGINLKSSGRGLMTLRARYSNNREKRVKLRKEMEKRMQHWGTARRLLLDQTTERASAYNNKFQAADANAALKDKLATLLGKDGETYQTAMAGLEADQLKLISELLQSQKALLGTKRRFQQFEARRFVMQGRARGSGEIESGKILNEYGNAFDKLIYQKPFYIHQMFLGDVTQEVTRSAGNNGSGSTGRSFLPWLIPWFTAAATALFPGEARAQDSNPVGPINRPRIEFPWKDPYLSVGSSGRIFATSL